MPVTEERQHLYYELIDSLLQCPNGKEPEVLEANVELIDGDLVNTMMQVASGFAHQGNEDGARFLVFIARELSIQLGLYPDLSQISTEPVSEGISEKE
ncbi:hypothetical protein [Calothrix sp. 336/3]|uniref:hypothetical protein n=1 Tax=Calothrix sp. 336/3 TaxID=1337936 RepID=UPI0004E39097|nr:hypothetical protein [Calothrix sp. 336/3]AKG23828.1 hypothetical protein IJ00_23265 [Calothrix sp. 336/3]